MKTSLRKLSRAHFLGFSVVVAVIGLVVWQVIAWASRQAEYEQIQTSTYNVFVAIHNYNDITDELPPTEGDFASWRGTVSWRVLTAGYMEAKVWKDTPLDQPLHRQQRHEWAKQGRGAELTNYYSGENPPNARFIAIVGHGTAWDREAYPDFDHLHETALIFVTVPDSNIHWMDPGDWTQEELFAALEKLGEQPIGLAFAYAGPVVVSANVPPDVLRRFCDVESARDASLDLLEPYILKAWERSP